MTSNSLKTQPIICFEFRERVRRIWRRKRLIDKGGYIEQSEYPVIFQGSPIECINYLRRVADRAEEVLKSHKVTLVFKHEPEPLTNASLTAELTVEYSGVRYVVRYAILERGPESCIKFLNLVVEETVWERKELFLPPK